MLTTKKNRAVKTVSALAFTMLLPVLCMLFSMQALASTKITASFDQQTGEVNYETETSYYYGILITLPNGIVKNEQVGSGIGGTMTWSLKNYFLQSGTYIIRVYALNNGEWPITDLDTGEILNAVKLSDVMTFNYAPGSNTLPTPSALRWYADGKYFGLKWNVVNGAVKYSVKLYEDGNLQLTYITESPDWLIYSPQMTTGHKYTATVQAISGSLNANDSAVSAKCAALEIDASGKGISNGRVVTNGEDYEDPDVSIVGGKYYYKGTFDSSKSGFVNYAGGKFFLVKGVVAKNVSGLVQDPDHRDDWYFCASGQVASRTTLVQYPAKTDNWFFVEYGKLDTTYNGFVNYNGGKFFLARGRLVRAKNGLVQDPNNKNDWYFLANGQVQAKKTGIAIYNGAGFYVVNGKLDSSYTGTVTDNGVTYNVANGRVV